MPLRDEIRLNFKQLPLPEKQTGVHIILRVYHDFFGKNRGRGTFIRTGAFIRSNIV